MLDQFLGLQGHLQKEQQGEFCELALQCTQFTVKRIEMNWNGMNQTEDKFQIA